MPKKSFFPENIINNSTIRYHCHSSELAGGAYNIKRWYREKSRQLPREYHVAMNRLELPPTEGIGSPGVFTGSTG